VTEFGGQEPFSLILGPFIPEPPYKVEQLAVAPLAVDLRVEDLGDFVLGFAVDYNRRGWWLYSVRDCIRDVRFELGDMKDRMHGPHGVGESESS
jgi:hypothetical protein